MLANTMSACWRNPEVEPTLPLSYPVSEGNFLKPYGWSPSAEIPFAPQHDNEFPFPYRLYSGYCAARMMLKICVQPHHACLSSSSCDAQGARPESPRSRRWILFYSFVKPSAAWGMVILSWLTVSLCAQYSIGIRRHRSSLPTAYPAFSELLGIRHSVGQWIYPRAT